MEIKEDGAYRGVLKLFTAKDDESGDFISSNLELALKKEKKTKGHIRIKSLLKCYISTIVDGDISEMNSIIKRTLTTPVRGDDEQHKKTRLSECITSNVQ